MYLGMVDGLPSKEANQYPIAEYLDKYHKQMADRIAKVREMGGGLVDKEYPGIGTVALKGTMREVDQLRKKAAQQFGDDVDFLSVSDAS